MWAGTGIVNEERGGEEVPTVYHSRSSSHLSTSSVLLFTEKIVLSRLMSFFSLSLQAVPHLDSIGCRYAMQVTYVGQRRPALPTSGAQQLQIFKTYECAAENVWGIIGTICLPYSHV